jgi:hypothetical protein
MTSIDFTDEEPAAVAAVVRRSISDDKFPLSPRMAPLKPALGKLDPAFLRKPLPEYVPLPQAPPRMKGGKRARR